MKQTALSRSQKYNVPLLVLLLRWAALIPAVITSVHFLGPLDVSEPLYAAVILYALYNLFYTLFNRRIFKRNVKTAVALADIVFISVFVYFSGGVYSEIYVLYFFVLSYCANYAKLGFTVTLSAVSLVAFCTASAMHAAHFDRDFNYMLFLLKAGFMLAASYGLGVLVSELNRYDQLRRKEFKLARTDKLTGLANRHYFEQKIDKELQHSDSTGAPLNVLMFDLDNFKRFNDTYGHVWGDKLLTLFADIIKQNIRSTDIPVRYGGEEFLLLLRDIDIDLAYSVGDRIRRHLERQKIMIDGEYGRKMVTVSCGVAQYPLHASNIKDVIECADKALYHAKETGKNCVCTYDRDMKIHIEKDARPGRKL